MNKRQIIASLNKIANELDIDGLYTEANTVTKVMKKLAQVEEQETPQKLSPYDLRDEDIKYINDDELNKKQFLMSMTRSATEFAHFVIDNIEELGLYREKPQLYEVVFDMIAKNYPPDNYAATPKIAKVLNNIWNEYNKFRDENIQQAYIDEELSAKSGIPKASDEENKRVYEQSSQLRGLVLIALKRIIETRRVGINTQYMFNNDLVEDRSQDAYTTKYSPEKPGQ